jgi:hypothetical protein
MSGRSTRVRTIQIAAAVTTCLIGMATSARAYTVESVVNSAAESAAVRAYLLQGANKARVPVDELTDLYVCVANATRGDGHTQRELVDVAVSIELIQIISGATGVERKQATQAACDLLRDLPH